MLSSLFTASSRSAKSESDGSSTIKSSSSPWTKRKHEIILFWSWILNNLWSWRLRWMVQFRFSLKITVACNSIQSGLKTLKFKCLFFFSKFKKSVVQTILFFQKETNNIIFVLKRFIIYFNKSAHNSIPGARLITDAIVLILACIWLSRLGKAYSI